MVPESDRRVWRRLCGKYCLGGEVFWMSGDLPSAIQRGRMRCYPMKNKFAA